MHASALPSQGPHWSHGRYGPARWVESPNCNHRPQGAAVDLIVVHSISLPPGIFEGNAVERLFTNRLDWDAHPYFQSIRGLEVSAHFLIRRDGQVVQFVNADQRAWHAGASFYAGRSARNDDSIGIELEGLEGGLFTAAQYAALSQLCNTLRQHYPIADIAGHEDIAPGRKQDPGAGFDWAQLQQRLQWPVAMFPARWSSTVLAALGPADAS